jgi:hypothetical protein
MRWTDPQLGEFTFDDLCQLWETVVVAPAFDAFRYHWNMKPTDPKYQPPDGRYALQIIDKDGTTDRPAAVALAQKVLGNQVALVGAVIAAVWEDINGRGPESGMWWHGDFSFPKGDTTGLRQSSIINCLTEDGFVLDGPEDLKQLMRLCDIVIRNNVSGYNGSLVELGFDAAFEMEHGVGILTDGDQILGTGYRCDVDLFAR